MKICDRLLNFIQIIDYKGHVRACGWINNNIIGCLADNSMDEIYHSRHADELRNKLVCGDYSDCLMDACPYLSMNTINEHLIEIDEIPQYPEKLCLAYEEVCNYKCISCTTPEVMCNMNRAEAEQGYDVIEERLKDVLPYVKTISTNGRGEIFVSKRILNLLANWNPLAPKEDITVEIESNGSLFDEAHWKQIENIGQYNVRVAITVMSFDEEIYQVLSGCKLPIKQIENNLHFIRKLREQGIVNYFEIATVVQDRNFRTLPEFTRRCIEEFGADCVRLRPYMPWGSQEPHIEWFMDVRNKKHPYYNEYRRILENPIFQNPKVRDWSGGLDSLSSNEIPYRIDAVKKRILSDLILDREKFWQKCGMTLDMQYVIYGIGEIGMSIIKTISGEEKAPMYIIDKYCGEKEYYGIKKYNLSELSDLNKEVYVLITPLLESNKIKCELQKLGYTKVICLSECYC